MGLRTALGLKRWNSARAGAHKFGVLRFGYENFFAFDEQLQKHGAYDINLGDSAQSIAVRSLFHEMGIADDEIIDVNRDTLPSYAGPPCSLVMNAVFFRQSFPLPPQVRPIFIGFHADAEVIRANLGLFKLHEPIGCRDTATTERMRRFGIKAFTTGCVTLALPPRKEKPADGRLLIVYGSDFPASILEHIPLELKDHCEFIYHRLPVDEFPVSLRTSQTAESYEKSLLDRYRRTAKLVLTPLHHVAAPCIAMSIPAIVCRSSRDDRFSFLEQLAPVYTPEDFGAINWRPESVDVSATRDRIKRLLAEAVRTVHGP